MQARCPHCQNVFGTDRTGIQFCPNCGQQINVPASGGAPASPEPPPSGFVPPPAFEPQGAPSPATGREATPWERRAEVGAIKGLWETWKQSMFSPESFFAKVRPEAPWGDALLYAWILFAVSSVFQLPFQMFQLGINSRTMKMDGLPPEFAQMMETFGSGKPALLLMLGGIVLFPLMVLVGSAITHLFCLMFGCARNGFGATFRALAYASSPVLVMVVPCLGGCFGPVYSMVLAVIAVAKLQDSTYGRAAAAVLAPVLAICCCYAAGVAAIVATVVGAQ